MKRRYSQRRDTGRSNEFEVKKGGGWARSKSRRTAKRWFRRGLAQEGEYYAHYMEKSNRASSGSATSATAKQYLQARDVPRGGSSFATKLVEEKLEHIRGSRRRPAVSDQL